MYPAAPPIAENGSGLSVNAHIFAREQSPIYANLLGNKGMRNAADLAWSAAFCVAGLRIMSKLVF